MPSKAEQRGSQPARPRLIPDREAPATRKEQKRPNYAVSPSHSWYGKLVIPDWYADDPPTDEEMEAHARRRDQALLDWQDAKRDYRANHEEPPLRWDTWREAKVYDRLMAETLKAFSDALQEAGEKYRQMICVRGVNDRPPTPGSPGAVALEEARDRRRMRPQLITVLENQPQTEEQDDTQQRNQTGAGNQGSRILLQVLRPPGPGQRNHRSPPEQP